LSHIQLLSAGSSGLLASGLLASGLLASGLFLASGLLAEVCMCPSQLIG